MRDLLPPVQAILRSLAFRAGEDSLPLAAKQKQPFT